MNEPRYIFEIPQVLMEASVERIKHEFSKIFDANDCVLVIEQGSKLIPISDSGISLNCEIKYADFCKSITIKAIGDFETNKLKAILSALTKDSPLYEEWSPKNA